MNVRGATVIDLHYLVAIAALKVVIAAEIALACVAFAEVIVCESFDRATSIPLFAAARAAAMLLLSVATALVTEV